MTFDGATPADDDSKLTKNVNDSDNLAPEYWKSAFECPNCLAYAHQVWSWASETRFDPFNQIVVTGSTIKGLTVAVCECCKRYSLWVNEKLIHPSSSTAPMPSIDMPEEVKAEYLEARDIFEKSPRAAGGLLRIGFEKLLPFVGATKKEINEAIKELVQKGLALGTPQQAMDIVRIFANQSVHNGFVKLEDQPEVVYCLFNLMNYIVEQMITRPKQIQSLYAGIPAEKLAAIQKRDGSM